ncbi:ABC transporter ATP-binding protein [Gracilibacillus dipsosauri]|uniref:ABC transporter ATP-binding protein n=1 Tax=Gracilibacillus dipsosauri TaxID=178340 RepID=UPI00240900AA
MPILEVKDLSISFKQYTSFWKEKTIKAISSLNVMVEEGEIVAVVGASGSGKSLLAHAILGILPSKASIDGGILFQGKELTPELQKTLRGREISLVPQSVNSLDPLMKIGSQVRNSVNNRDAFTAQREIFKRYQLKTEVEKKYPFELSGGMARRALLSTAMVSQAKLIIADEPTPGLDADVLEKALNHIRELADTGSAVLFITHDIESALKIADKIAVFYAGTTVEIAPVENFKGKGEKLRHPYSKALWRALPQNDFIPIPGTQPIPSNLPEGCLFATRCEWTTPDCRAVRPVMRELRNGMVRCIHAT